MHIAAAKGHESVTEQLIAARSNVDPQLPCGATPRFIAAENGHASCCERHWRGVSRRLCWTYMRTGDVMHAELACANEPGRREGAPRGHAAVLQKDV